MQQISVRLDDDSVFRINHLAETGGHSKQEIVTAAVDLLWCHHTALARGALNESEQLAVLGALENWTITPSPGRAVYFIQTWAARMLDTMWLATRRLEDLGGEQPAMGERANILEDRDPS